MSIENAPGLEEGFRQESDKIRIVKKSTEQEGQKEAEKVCQGFHEAEDAGLFKPGTKIEMECIKWPRYPSGEVSGETSREGYPKIIMPCPDGTEMEITIYPGSYHNFKKLKSEKNSDN
ncbi:MAG: hypothetical protein PHW01_02765 [Patescibacteria group bacterium]|nr:hypothetical protein [Patescibacteria group bacterium]